MNTYEQKQEAKRERLEARAIRKRNESEASSDRAHDLVSGIPFGQPILVGHHSEKRHRRTLDKSWAAMGKAVRLGEEADDLDRRAAAVGSGGISGDDPEAVQKLKEKLAGMEANQVEMKAVNKAHKAYLKNPASLDKSDLSDGLKETIRNYKPTYSWEPHPFPPYAMQNNNANMRRVKLRIKELENRPTEAGEPITGNGYKIEERPDDNRIWCIFEGRPTREVCKLMRGNGWKWSPTRTAWIYNLHNRGRYVASSTAAQLDGLGTLY